MQPAHIIHSSSDIVHRKPHYPHALSCHWQRKMPLLTHLGENTNGVEGSETSADLEPPISDGRGLFFCCIPLAIPNFLAPATASYSYRTSPDARSLLSGGKLGLVEPEHTPQANIRAKR